MKQKKARSSMPSPKKDLAAGYDHYKFFKGKQYTGMAVGRSHKWYYDKGIWLDKKITPDKWLINFEVTKRRAGHAPEGSGVPVGTEYHWFILSHQLVKKLNANDYSTKMNGYKFKIAHKRSNKDKWNISDKTQKNHLIKVLKEFIKELEAGSTEEFVASEQNMVKPAKKIATKKAMKPKDRLAKTRSSSVKRKRAAKKEMIGIKF
jgi:hypothetical protein